MNKRIKKKQEKMALEKALEQEKKERQARTEAEKQKERDAAFLAWRQEQDEIRKKAIKDMADSAVAAYVSQTAPENPMTMDNPEDYIIEEPTGIFGKISKFAKEHSKGIKTTGAAIGVAVMVFALAKVKGCEQDNLQRLNNNEPLRPGFKQNITPEAIIPNRITPEVPKVPDVTIALEEPEYLDVTPEVEEDEEIKTTIDDKNAKEQEQGKETLQVGEEPEKKIVKDSEKQKENTDKSQKTSHTHSFTSLVGETTYMYNYDNPHTHTASSVYQCECGDNITIAEIKDCVYETYLYDEFYEYEKCIYCGYEYRIEHEMDDGVVDSKTKDTTYSCIHDGCDYSYVEKHAHSNDKDSDDRGHSSNAGSSHSSGSSGGSFGGISGGGSSGSIGGSSGGSSGGDQSSVDTNKENINSADSVVSQGDREHETVGKDDHADSGEYGDDDELDLSGVGGTSVQGNTGPVDNGVVQSQEPPASAPTTSEPAASAPATSAPAASSEAATVTSNSTIVSGSSDQSAVLGVTETVYETRGQETDDLLTMASIMYDYYTGAYGFDDNDLDEGFGRNLKL